MEKKNYVYNILIAFCIIIILIFLFFCALLMTKIIKLKSNEDVSSKKEVVDFINNDFIIGDYQSIIKYTDNSYKIYEINFDQEGSVKYLIGSSNTDDYSDASVIMSYSGTYSLNGNNVILTIKSDDVNCIDGKYSCNDTMILETTNDNRLKDNELLFNYVKKNSELILNK